MSDTERETIERCRAAYNLASKAFDQAQKLLNGLSVDLRDVTLCDLWGSNVPANDPLVQKVRRRYEVAREAYDTCAEKLATAARERLDSGEHLDELVLMVLKCK